MTELYLKERTKPAAAKVEAAMEKLQIESNPNPKKRKPAGTLVNPYLKKRKVQGAKFTTE